MTIKMVALGPKTYARDRYNLFDAFVVVITIAESIVNLSISEDNF